MSGLLEKLHLKHAHAAPTTTGAAAPLNTTQPLNTTHAPVWTPGQSYSGLNFPYQGATAHPTYGYNRLSAAQKAQRFELKAAEWERRGNMAKAQKNREKALKYRSRGQPGYVRPQRSQNYYIDRANLFNQKALQYQTWGMQPQYQRYLGRANRIRAKRNLPAYVAGTNMSTFNQPLVHQTTHVVAPIVQETVRQDRIVEVQPVVHKEIDQNVVHHIEKHYTEVAPSMAGQRELAPVVQQQVHTNVVNEIQPIIHRERVVPVVERAEQHLTQHVVAPTIHTHEVVYETGAYVGQTTGATLLTKQYTGLNFPYTGTAVHPTYGYARLPHNKKAERFELKAAEWERRGNLAKAQKNREKALKYRARSQPGYVAPVRPQNYYVDRANLYNQKALQYQQMGMQPQYQRYQGRANRIRTKRNLPPFAQDQYLKQQQMGAMGAPVVQTR